MPSESLPAISLVAVPGRRRQTLEIAREAERRGYAGVYIPSRFGNMAQCTALAIATERIPFGTAIAPIYARTVEDFAHSAAYIHEVSGGRFHFGIGIAHGPTYQRLGITPGKPLSDTRNFVEKLKSFDAIGALPPIILATLRKKMVALAAEISDGMVFANASLSHMPQSLACVPAAKRNDPQFLIANMLPVCISEDVSAARALLRRRLVRYAMLPNYRAYWKEAGYVDEMAAVERAIGENRPDEIPQYLTDRWLSDNTLYGPAAKIREGVEAWRAAGVSTPILVPNSVNGNQITALQELFSAFAG
jgi:alkanesulfonate monooxygenase SsuD/methylene tetrahydromethanopterin reductase-like flavin-dependent oxidoreductase (luciferase family)